MTLVRELSAELLAMFVADALLTLAILVLVAAVGGLVGMGVKPVLSGGILLLGAILVLVFSVFREARVRAQR